MLTYKPQFDGSAGGGVFGSPGTQGTLTVFAPDGSIIFQGNPSAVGSEGPKWTLPIANIPPGSSFSVNGGPAHIISNPALRNEYSAEGGEPVSTGGMGDIGSFGGYGGGFGGAGGFGMLPNPYMIQFPSINYKPIKYTPIDAAPYKFIDPIEAARRYADFNLAQEDAAYQTGLARGTELTNLDTNATMDFAKKMSGLQMSLVESENAFNQAQRLKAVDFAMPDLRPALAAKKERADTYASGRLLSSAEDRAYQVAAQSASADGSFVRGFGDDSVFGKRTSDILSAQQRLGISQMGEGLLNDWISQGSSLLIDTPLKTSISQRLPSVPAILPSQQAAQQQNIRTNLATLPNQFGISSEINQQQFGTNLEQGTRTFNASNTFSKDQFNASNTLNKDQFNASGEFAESQAQFSGLQTNYQLATQASNRAEDIARQDAHNEAASVAAGQNISAQQDAGNVGSAGGILGTVVGAVTSGFGLLSQPTGPVTGQQSLQAVAGAPQQSAPSQVVQGSSAPVQPLNIVSGTPQQQQASAPQVPQMSGGGFSGGGGGGEQIQRTLGGGPTSYQGGAIPVASSPTDSGASALDISNGYKATGSLISDIGNSGPSTPQMTALGRGLSNGAQAAQTITSSFQSAATPEAKFQLTDQLHTAALGNAPTPESKESVNQIFSQVREHLDTGVGLKGQAAGIAGFVQHYDDYSEPEKARAITNITFAGQNLEANYGVKDLSSDSIGKVSVPGTNGKMTLQDALSLSNSGYNVSSLVQNWDDISEVHSTLNTKGNVLSIAATARNLGLLDSDTPEIIRNKQSVLRSVGATPAGAWGAGAVAFPEVSRKAVEGLGMTAIGKTTDGQLVAVPNASIASTGRTTGIVGSGMDSNGLKDLTTPTLAIGARAAQVYQNWDQDYVPRQQNSMGSQASVSNGLYKTGSTDPYLFGNIVVSAIQGYAVVEGIQAVMGGAAAGAAGVAASQILGGVGATAAEVAAPELIAGSFEAAAPSALAGVGAIAAPVAIGVGAVIAGKYVYDQLSSGKSGPQKARDSLRASAQELGLADQDFNLTLASGQKFNIGIDGHGGQREWFDPSQRRPDQTKISKLNAWDVDYTKDIDGVANVTGSALSILMYGNSDDPHVRQMGNYFTNAAVSDVGTASLTKESFDTTQKNFQKFFKDAGIETKQEAYALSNQLLHEGRISQVQAVQVQQGINLTFDQNAFQAANQLLEGVKLGRKGDGPAKSSEQSKKETSKKEAKPSTDDDLGINTPSIKAPKPTEMDPLKFDPSQMQFAELTKPMEIQAA